MRETYGFEYVYSMKVIIQKMFSAIGGPEHFRCQSRIWFASHFTSDLSRLIVALESTF